MRALLTGIFLCVMVSSSTNAASIGGLYKDCKKFADNSFEITLSDKGSGTRCGIYFSAIRDFASEICIKWPDEDGFNAGAKSALNIIRKIYGVGDINSASGINASIQHFVNAVASKPEDWKYSPESDVVKSLQAIGGACK
ncbi:hypothetical protein OAW66_01635 [Alphaproteobacteria bacterium]|nr:hypothetical protein [Alphaproteobacteria bacterium]